MASRGQGRQGAKRKSITSYFQPRNQRPHNEQGNSGIGHSQKPEVVSVQEVAQVHQLATAAELNAPVVSNDVSTNHKSASQARKSNPNPLNFDLIEVEREDDEVSGVEVFGSKSQLDRSYTTPVPVQQRQAV